MDWTISSQAATVAEGSTTISQESRAKRPETPGNELRPTLTTQERFDAKVDKETSQTFWNGTRCHEWTAYIAPNGYGNFRLNKKTEYAHRMAWILKNGPIPDGLFVLHRCDNRKCVNTEHHFLGTFDDNMDDMGSKGRRAVGEKLPQAKVTEEIARAIKGSSEKQAVLAARYGVTQGQISMIKSGKSWAHV
jgi:HNH endonuclease